ncbi:hypothetical protein [Methylobacterium nodulans]|uniref:hypothetical protein n=1 Tax=Methylobacterium nodulans TaxID=114616 RepID=UPI00313840A8
MPAGTKSVVLIVEDPDASFGIPALSLRLAEPGPTSSDYAPEGSPPKWMPVRRKGARHIKA